MLSEAKTEFSLEHWEAQRQKDLSGRYKKLIEIWGISGDLGEVLEIGTGPRGGVLPFVQASRKVGLDPLYDVFKSQGLLVEYPEIEYIVGCIEKGRLEGSFDTCLTANTLDHGESDFGSLRNIAELLKPGGRLFLHVHLRRLNQLNIGHDHALTLEQYEAQIVKAGFKEEWRRLYPVDPLEPVQGRYETLVSCLRKRTLKMIIRNDDVSFSTDLGNFRCFCELCDRFGYRILQAITPLGVIRCGMAGMSNAAIRALGRGKSLEDNGPVLEYLQSRPDLIGVHGLWHTHCPSEEEISQAIAMLEAWGLKPAYFVPPFHEGDYLKSVLGLTTVGKVQRLEDYLETGVPTDEIVYLHSWRFDGSFYSMKALELCLERISAIPS